jgi:hypothetical protein
MGTKGCSTGIMDALLTAICTPNGNLRIVLMASSGASWPITIASASSNSTGCLAQSTNGGFPTTGLFTIGSTGNNRYITIPACSCDTILQTDVASYVALIDDSSSIRYITTCTTQAVTAAGKVNIGTWQITVNIPT